MIKAAGYEQAFMTFGLIQGAIVLVMAWGLIAAAPQPAGEKVRVNQSTRHYAPTEVLCTPVFWVMYVMFVLVAAGGLTMAASVGPIAKDFKIDNVPVAMFGLALPALTFAISLNRVFDGFGRPFFGWVSDHIGRENTMFIAFATGAVMLLGLSQFGSNPLIFVILTAVYFGVYGEIFSLFPATQGDTFGSKFAAANAGMLYTAKGTGALLVPIATGVAHGYGWQAVFMTFMTFNIVAALLALVVLKPMRVKHFASMRTQSPGVAGAPPAPGLAATDAH
jgi:OFA family oxalate/formate antiporter-like MFS transporter